VLSGESYKIRSTAGRKLMKLQGKVAIVTGASRGLGQAIAIALATEGAAVVIAARSQKENESLPGTIFRTAELIRASGGEALAVKCDVTDEQSVNDMVESTVGRFGRVDILVNNAGTAFYRPFVEISLKRWEVVMRVNVTGPFLCSKAVAPLMIARKDGCIINISSLAADEKADGKVPTGLAYGVSKAALDRLTYGLAAELGRFGIAVNCVKPVEVVDTEGMRFWVEAEKRKGWVPPDQMVKCVLFLAGAGGTRVSGLVATDEELCAWYGL
jgi:citronellol/citronellal dehydrogenase